MATSALLDRVIDRMTAEALLLPPSDRGDWLMVLEMDLTFCGKDGFAIAMMVGNRLVYGSNGRG